MSVSFRIFVAAGIAAALNLFPLTGIVLVLLLGFYWTGFLLNIGFLCLAAEAAFGRVSRLLLIAPLVWFGGYGFYAARGQMELRQLRQTVEASNAAQNVRFQPGRDALSLAQEGPFEFRYSDLLEKYALDVLYEFDAPARTREGLYGYRAWRIAPPDVCNRIYNSENLQKQFGVVARPRMPGNGCYMATPEAPSGPLIEVAAARESTTFGGLIGEKTTISLATPDGPRTLLGYQVQQMPLIPSLIVGCYDFAHSNPCNVRFVSSYPFETLGLGKDDSDAISLVAEALKIAPRKGQAPLPSAAEGHARLNELGKPKPFDPLVALETLLRDPRIAPRPEELAIIKTRKDLLGPRADRLAAAAAKQSLDKKGQSGHVYQGLVAALPHEQFVRVAPGLLTALAGASESVRTQQIIFEGSLLERAGDLGAAGVPLLEAADKADSRSDRIFPIMVGFCRIGMPARDYMAETLERIVARVDFDEIRPARRKLWAIAALRIGRVDLADAIDRKARQTPDFRGQSVNPDTTGVVWTRDFPFWKSTIDRFSHPDVCSFPHMYYD